MNYFKKQLKLFEEKEEKSKHWLCADCGEKFRYCGQIAGTCARHCEFCKRYNGVFFLFDVSKKAYPWQKEHFSRP